MAAIQQLAQTLWRRKEKTPKTTSSDDEDENGNQSDRAMEEVGNGPIQQAETSSGSAATSDSSKKQRQHNRSSRWDRQRRFRPDKGKEDEKAKKRSRSLISSFFTDAFSSSSSTRQSMKANGDARPKKNNSFKITISPSSSNVYQQRVNETDQTAVTSLSPSIPALPGLGKPTKNTQGSNVQAFVAKFSGKASALVTPMPAGSGSSRGSSRRSSLTAASADSAVSPKSTVDDRSLVVPSSSFTNSKNLLNKKEGAGVVKESTDSSVTIEEQDGEIKSNSGGTNLKHENTVVHVDTVGMAAAAVAAAGVGIATSSVTSPSPLTTPTTPGLPPSVRKQEIIKVTEQLVDAITYSDYATYSKFCDVNMTCFEPEALGNLIEGLEFHKFYFDNAPNSGTQNSLKNIRSTILNPHVLLLSDDAACIAYVRLTQWIEKNGVTSSRRCEETRLWQKRDGQWRCVHFHRSTSSPSPVFAALCDGSVGTNSIANTPR